MVDHMDSLGPAQKKTVFFTVAGVLFFAAVNQTIVGTSLPKIVASLGGMEYFSWIFTVYMFTSSIAALIAGKLSDHYGRKKFFFSAILVMMAASFACGLSQSMEQLIAFRACQGIGGGILISLSFASVSDLFHVRERGKWQGLLTSTFGLSSLVGPTLGGAIVDSLHWRWIFWLFLPLGAGALVILRKYYPKDQPKAAIFHWDTEGTLFLTLFIAALLVFLGTHDLRLSYAALAVTPFALGLFIYSEMRARDPILPLRLFKKNNFTTANVSGFLLGVSMFGVIIYIPFYLQGVMALSGLYSGTMMMTMTVTLVSASALAGRAISRTGHYKFFGILGIALMVAGMFWMSRLQPDSAALTVYLRLIIFGSGLGISFTISTFAVQLDVGHAHAGLAISSSQLFRQIGGTVGVSLFGKIFTALFAAKIAAIPLPTQLPAAQLLATNPRMLLDSHALAGLSSAVPKEGLSIFFEFVRLCRQSLGESLDTLFFYGCGILLLALAVALFMHEYPLKDESAKSELNPREVA